LTTSPFKSGFVAVVGRPNVGKSTLMNALLGQKVAIVSPRPQTTRRKQLGILNLENAQIIFVDTPGIHRPKHALDKSMQVVANEALYDADAVLWLVDASEPPSIEDKRIAEMIARNSSKGPTILALNKSDRLKPHKVVANVEAFRALVPDAQWMLTSATRGDNLDKLQAMLIEALPEGPQYYDPEQITDFQLRDIAAELIREAALEALRDEVPHGIAVEIEEFKEPQGKAAHIGAIIYVERDSHKGILIGKGGEMLKAIGTRARKEIEKQLDGPVFLELFVKVKADWRNSERDVRGLGYGLQDEE
jgi:GTP-binding protein Era